MFLHFSDLVLRHSILCEGKEETMDKEKDRSLSGSTPRYMAEAIETWKPSSFRQPGTEGGSKQESERPGSASTLSLTTSVYLSILPTFSKS